MTYIFQVLLLFFRPLIVIKFTYFVAFVTDKVDFCSFYQMCVKNTILTK